MRVETAPALGARRVGMGCGARVLIAATVFLLVSVVSALIFVVFPSRGNVAASFIGAQPGALPWNTSHRLNVLLLGVSTQGTVAHANSMIIASFDPRSDSIDLLSIPGNLWVTIPGFGRAGISEADADGGPRLALLTVEAITGVPIPYYAAVREQVFRQLVDALGGLTLDVSPMVARRAGTGQLRVGRDQIDGAHVLIYLRASSAEVHNITQQMMLQQHLLLALRRTLQPSLFKVPALVGSLGGSIATNFPYNQIPSLARTLAAVRASHIHQHVLNVVNGSATAYRVGDASVLLPDVQNIRSLARKTFVDAALNKVHVEVLNGSGQQGEAASLATWLRQVGVHVRGYASAQTFGYARTSVVVDRGASGPTLEAAQGLAALLQAHLQMGRVSRVPVEVVIGRNYQDLSQQ